MDQSIMNVIMYNNPNTFIIFFTPECNYCKKALSLLRNNNVSFKSYNINLISGGLPNLLAILNRNSHFINFNPAHRTKPIIFYNGKYIGGYSELEQMLH